MNTIIESLPLIIPLLMVHLVLAIFALIHIIKNPHYRFGNKPMWIVIVFVVQFIGSIIYFVFGRGEEK